MRVSGHILTGARPSRPRSRASIRRYFETVCNQPCDELEPSVSDVLSSIGGPDTDQRVNVPRGWRVVEQVFSEDNGRSVSDEVSHGHVPRADPGGFIKEERIVLGALRRRTAPR